MYQKCPICNGTGKKLDYTKCHVCNGKGIISSITGNPPQSNDGDFRDFPMGGQQEYFGKDKNKI